MNFEYEDKYIEDIIEKNLLYSKLIRVEDKIGKISSIFVPEKVKEIPDIIIAGYKDIPGKKTIDIEGDKAPIFPKDIIQYLGQPILIVAHPDERILHQACELITIKIEEIPSYDFQNEIPDIQKSFVQIVGEKKEEFGSPDKLIKNAYTTIEKNYFTSEQNYHATEHIGVIIKRDNDKIVILSGSNKEKIIKENISAILKKDKNFIEIKQTKKNSIENKKNWIQLLLAAQASIISEKTKKSVSLILTKREEILYLPKRAPMAIRKITAIDEKRQPIAEKTEIFINAGAFPLFTKTLINDALNATSTIYKKIPSTVIIRIITTNRPSMDYFNGSIAAQIQFMVEKHEENIAKYLKKDSIQWKLSNLKQEIISKKIDLIFEECIKTADYRRKTISFNNSDGTMKNLKTLKRKRGIGIAFGYQLNDNHLKTYGALSVEVELDSISNKIKPLTVVLVIQNAINNKVQQKIKTTILQTLNWLNNFQAAKTSDERINFIEKTSTHLPNIKIHYIDKLVIKDSSFTNLIENSLPAAFISATSQALNQKIDSIPLNGLKKDPLYEN